MVTTSNRISGMSVHWATTTNQSNRMKKKTLFTMAPLNHMHKGHCSYLTILKMAAANSIVILPLPPNKPFDQITSTNTTELAASVNTVDRTVSSDRTDGTAKTLLKLVELITRNHGHFASVSQQIWTPRGGRSPFAALDPSTKLSFWASFVSYLVTNSICKLSVDVLFNHNTTFLNKGKEKQPFRSNSAAFIIASRTVYARIRCEQTTAFELLKLLQ